MALKDIFAKTAKAITGSPSSDEIREVRREAQGRLTAVERRLETIREGGREYSRTLLEGTTDELAALEDEARALAVEQKQLRARLSELNQKQRHAQATEAVRDAKAMKDALANTINEAEEAAAAYERARKETERKVRAIREGLRACQRENVDGTALLVDRSTLERAAALLEAGSGKSRADWVRELQRDMGDPSTKPKPRREPNTGALVG